MFFLKLNSDTFNICLNSFSSFHVRIFLAISAIVDASIDEHDRVAFNAGDLRHSVVLSTEDYLRAAQGAERGTFSKA